MADQYIEYNEFSFPFNKLEVTQTAVMADDKITQLGTEYAFAISGVVSASDQHAFVTQVNTMRAKLSVPAKSFKASLDSGDNTLTMYEFHGDASLSDNLQQADWGPHPGPLQLSQFSGGLACRYNWTVRAYLHECYTPACVLSDNGGQVLGCVRKFDYSVDLSGFTTRTVSGKLTVTAASARNGSNADAFRYYVTPPVPTNFHRTAQSFGQSEDGTELSFSFTDAEEMYTLPDPITDGGATFAVSVDAGLKVNYVLSGSFGAPPSVGKDKIITRILDLAAYYFPVSDALLVFESRQFTASIYHPNRIDFTITATSAAGTGDGGQPDYNVGLGPLTGTPPGSTGTTNPVYPDGGDAVASSGVSSPAPKRYDACIGGSLAWVGTGQRGSLDLAQGPKRDGSNPTAPVTSGTSGAHRAAPYVAYHAVISYELDNGLVFFEPKVKGKRPIKQQARPPALVVIQAGYAMRYAANPSDGPVAPKPVLGKGVLLSASVEPHVPEPIGDGSVSRYTLHWRYVIKYTDFFKSSFGECEPQYPTDPRRPPGQTVGLDIGDGKPLPEVLVPPA